MAKNFIKAAIKHPEALHKQLHIPNKKQIPVKALQHAAKASGVLGRRARFALTLRGLKK